MSIYLSLISKNFDFSSLQFMSNENINYLIWQILVILQTDDKNRSLCNRSKKTSLLS